MWRKQSHSRSTESVGLESVQNIEAHVGSGEITLPFIPPQSLTKIPPKESLDPLSQMGHSDESLRAYRKRLLFRKR